MNCFLELKNSIAQSHTAHSTSIYAVYNINYPNGAIDDHQEHKTHHTRCDHFVFVSSHRDWNQMIYGYQNKMKQHIFNGRNEYQYQICEIIFLVMSSVMYTMGKTLR